MLCQSPPPTVIMVDDDPSVLRCLSRIVRQAGYEARTFRSAEEFLAERPDPLSHPGCLILDLQLPGLGGLGLQLEVHSGPAPWPVIFISGHGDIPATVTAMQQGAETFLTKPFDHHDLLEAIATAVRKHRSAVDASCRSSELRRRIDALSQREREVMAWVITGALNKQIAAGLGIVEQTVKVHRARVMEKMQAASVAELVRLCDRAGFEPALR